MLSYTKEQQLKRPRQKREGVKKEAVLQSQAEAYLKLRNIPFIRIPDSAYAVIFGQQRMSNKDKAFLASFLKGLPDLTIFKKHGDYNLSLCIELKSKDGKLSHHQQHWSERVRTVVIRTFEEFVKAVDEFEKEGV